MHNAMRAVSRFLIMVVFVLAATIPGTLLYVGAPERWRQAYVRWVFRCLCAIIGMRVRVHGRLDTHRPLLLVSNHTSYLDIFALGAAAPLSFTPKNDIKAWPLVNLCCVLSGCVFVERKPSKLPATRQAIHRALQNGRVICLFPEGTTDDGHRLKPFKSSFLSLAEAEPGLKVQPASLRYTHRNGQALDAAGRRAIAWIDELALMPHLMRVLSARRIDVSVRFHEPLTLARFASRKELTQACEAVVKQDIED